jgi:hypothetical protein
MGMPRFGGNKVRAELDLGGIVLRGDTADITLREAAFVLPLTPSKEVGMQAINNNRQHSST